MQAIMVKRTRDRHKNLIVYQTCDLAETSLSDWTLPPQPFRCFYLARFWADCWQLYSFVNSQPRLRLILPTGSV